MRAGWIAIALLSSSGCLFVSRDNLCDPEAAAFDLEACRVSCDAIDCGSGAGSVVSATEGCSCIPCDQITCGADEYRVGCGCAPLHGRLDCNGGNCTLQCIAGYDDCNDQTTDGCETVLANDAAHCGRCDRSCGGTTCTGGQCEPMMLASGFEL